MTGTGTGLASVAPSVESIPAPAPAPTLEKGRSWAEALCDAGTYRSFGSESSDLEAGRGEVDGRPVVCWSQSGSRRGGSLDEQAGATIERAIAEANSTGAPLVSFPHSAGASLHAGVSALSTYARIFRAQIKATVPQITIVGAFCAGGAAYAPALGDLTVMAGPDSKLFLTGPKVVASVMPEQISAEELGGPKVHTANGVAHLFTENRWEAIDVVRDLLGFVPYGGEDGPSRHRPAPPLGGSPDEVIPEGFRAAYDVRDVVQRLVDRGRLIELGPRWAKNMLVGFASLEGRPIGVIANQPRHLGGAIDVAGSEKGEWFVRLCDRFGLPLLVLVDTPGFLPGQRQESTGIIRHGARLLRAFVEASVPKVTVTLRHAYGGAHIVMNSRYLGSDLTLAWPTSRLGVMGASQAVKIIHRRDLENGADGDALADQYQLEHLTASAALRRGAIDAIVTPEQTREYLARQLLFRSRNNEHEHQRLA